MLRPKPSDHSRKPCTPWWYGSSLQDWPCTWGHGRPMASLFLQHFCSSRYSQHNGTVTGVFIQPLAWRPSPNSIQLKNTPIIDAKISGNLYKSGQQRRTVLIWTIWVKTNVVYKKSKATSAKAREASFGDGSLSILVGNVDLVFVFCYIFENRQTMVFRRRAHYK